MTLDDLLKVNNISMIDGVTSDSRRVKKGFLFAALPGNKVSGTKFISDAIMHGAKVILAQEGTEFPTGHDDVQFITVSNPRQAFAKVAAAFYKLQPENIVAVTGTSGKTSTVSFVQQLWHLSGKEKCASLGTLGLRGPGLRRYGSLTTPDTETLHADLADLAAVGIDHLAMEASSHGLDQYRLDGVKIKAAVFNNLSRDHLDYHGTMENYFDAKARLFTEVMESGSGAVLNADDAVFPKIKKICEEAGHHILSFGYEGQDIKVLKRVPKPDGQDVVVDIQGKEYSFRLPLVGEFQVMNALAAVGLLMAIGERAEDLVPLLERLWGVNGRLQLIDGHPTGAVYIDYAHKPAALEAVLQTLRPHTENRLICVFGCGGNRDPGKRAMMGKIAMDLADRVIVTDDNPRYEDAAQIRSEIMEAVPSAEEIGDRASAIDHAVRMLEAGDVLVVAGKGHEQGQIIGDDTIPFDDEKEVIKTIERLKKS